MWILTVHAILYYAYWGTTGSFRRSFAAWGGSGEVSNLAGSCAYFAGLVLWGSSLTWVRRHFYEVGHHDQTEDAADVPPQLLARAARCS